MRAARPAASASPCSSTDMYRPISASSVSASAPSLRSAPESPVQEDETMAAQVRGTTGAASEKASAEASLTPTGIEDCVELLVLLLRQLVRDHSPLTSQRLRARGEELYQRSFLINAWTNRWGRGVPVVMRA